MTYSVFPPASSGIPEGNTAARPASPEIGDTYYNGELGILEIYNGSDSSNRFIKNPHLPVTFLPHEED